MSVNIVHRLKENAPLIMGIVNVTPDSFSDGGSYLAAEKAIAHGKLLLEQGADILDIGGESTRPNAMIVPVEEEILRIVPVIKGLAGIAPYISVDTRNSKTMIAAIKAGANIINDVSALTHDPKSIDVISGSDVTICIMHMKGNPKNMQINPEYGNVVDEIMAFFEERLEFCLSHNVDHNRVILDPGIGFGKALSHNLEILKNLSKLKGFGCPLMLGASRKNFINQICSEPVASSRIYGSIAAAIHGLNQGASIFRVHDVMATKQAFDVYRAINS